MNNLSLEVEIARSVATLAALAPTQPSLSFSRNVERNVRNIRSKFAGSNIVLAEGQTQSGKQYTILDLIDEEIASCIKYSNTADDEEPSTAVIAFDLLMDSDRFTKQQKIERNQAKFLEREYESGEVKIPWFVVVGHHDDLIKAQKDADKNVLDAIVMGVHEKISYEMLIQIKESFSNLRIVACLDEADQYKHKNGAIHKFLSDYCEMDLSDGSTPLDCKVLLITATPYDIAAFVSEKGPNPPGWACLSLTVPKDYYGLKDALLAPNRLEDYDNYCSLAKAKNPTLKGVDVHISAILEIIKATNSDFMSSDKDLFIVRPPASKTKEYEKLVGEIQSVIASFPAHLRPKLLQANMSNEEDCRKFEKMLKECPNRSQRNRKAFSALSKLEAFSKMQSKAIVLLKNKYQRGCSLPMHNVFGWLSSHHDRKSDSTYMQDLGRALGVGKANDNHIIFASRKAVMNVVSKVEKWQTTGDINNLAYLKSNFSKIEYSKKKSTYEVILIKKGDQDFIPSFSERRNGKTTTAKPLNLSTRAKNNRGSKSPDELILEGLQQQTTIGQTLFPIEHGGQHNSKYQNKPVSAIRIDSPSANCPPAVKQEIQKLIDDGYEYVIQRWTGKSEKEVIGATVSRLPPSKKPSTCLSEY